MPACKTADHSDKGRKGAPMSLEALQAAADLCKALGDAPRLQLLQLLMNGEWCVTEIVAALGEKFSTVSQRLRTLRTEGLVKRRRAGNHLFYALSDRHVADLVQNALAHADELQSRPARLVPARDV
jgi:ArsR family transcriptional regulator, lead/cadmium/zinc/bismuth-responsive transcriptional repressor